jgi:predicted secreted Zn-dependent protease
MKLALVFLVLSQLMLGQATAQNRVAYSHKVKVATYPVFGKSTRELEKGMHTNGPISHLGKRHYAYTLWQFRIGRNRFNIIPETSKATDFVCKVSVNLPAAQIKIGDLSKKWDKFLTALIAHENIHVKQAIRLCNILKGAKVKPSRLQSFSKRLRLRDQKLDKDSQHGKLSGVSLN